MNDLPLSKFHANFRTAKGSDFILVLFALDRAEAEAKARRFATGASEKAFRESGANLGWYFVDLAEAEAVLTKGTQ